MTINNMNVALQSDALVALHIRNGSFNGGVNISVDVPIQHIVKPRNIGGELTEALLISNLRQCAVTALLESQPNQPLPVHLLKRFELSSYQSKNGINLSCVDNTLSRVLESSVTLNISSDEGVVLHIFCAFANKCHSSYSRPDTRRIRASAAAAGGRERKRLATNLKGWAVNKKRSVADNLGSKREYVAIPYANNPHPLQRWRDRVVNLIVPDGMDEEEFIRQKAEAAKQCAETTVNYLIEGAMKTSEKFCQYATPYHLQPFSNTRVVPRKEFNHSEADIEKSEEGIEIIFESGESTNSSSEWQVIFEVDKSDSDSMGSMVGSMVSLDSSLAIDHLDCDLITDSPQDCVVIVDSAEDCPQDCTDIVDSTEDCVFIDSIENSLEVITPKIGPVIDTQSSPAIDTQGVISASSSASESESESEDDGIVIDLDVMKSFSSSVCTRPKNNTTADENLSYDTRDSSVGALSIDDDDDSSWALLDEENGL